MRAFSRPSSDRALLIARITLFLASAAVVYCVTWGLLLAAGRVQWLAVSWLAESYLLMVGAYVSGVWQPGRRQKKDRRKLPRVPVAVPVRYATEDGHVGIGVLVDVHETGAGLILPKETFDANRVWMQSVWFDDRVGIQGKVIHSKETPYGLRLGLQLQGLHPESVDFLSRFAIPLGRQGKHFPVQIEQGSLNVWAITEIVGDRGATLLLPRALLDRLPVKMSVWGSPRQRECAIATSKLVRPQPFPLYRVEVCYRETSATPVDQGPLTSPVTSTAS